ncbi:glycosyltransferase family 4 protein [Candidatus Microgenomates bacterium]|nr:glycosyltransferase family 4 protein [Candidatus Microgenomates bacterium]
MKILIDARMYGLENAGIGRYTVNLIEQIKQIDSTNDYVVLLRKKYFDKLILPKNFKKILVDFRHYSFREQVILPKIILSEKPDLTHFVHFNVPVWFKGKFVVTIHDLLMHRQKGLSATTLNPAFYYLKRMGYKKVFEKAVKDSKRIIVPSNFVKDDIVNTYHINPQKIAMTYLGVDVPLVKEKDVNEVLEKFKLKEKDYFLYVGSAYPHKNLKRAMEASDASKTTLAISCARNVFLDRLEKDIQKTHTQNYVKILGFVPDEDLAILYKKSLGFVYPSIMEGFGLQGLEAMANETLLLASEIPVFKEIYKDNAIYFNPFDFSDISRKMDLVKQMSKEKRKEIINHAKEYSTKFSWKKMAQETLKIYEESCQE